MIKEEFIECLKEILKDVESLPAGAEVRPMFMKDEAKAHEEKQYNNRPQYEIDHERGIVYKTTGDFKYKEQIEDILNEFDFKLASQILELIDIERTEEELKKLARELLENAIDHNRSACGGLCATNVSGLLTLYVDICEWEACVEQDTITTTGDLDILRDNCNGECE